MALFDDSRGAIAVLAALTLPLFIGAAAFSVDLGMWYLQATRLQSAADAAALGAGYLLSDSALKSQGAGQQQAAFQSVALTAAQNESNSAMIGTLSTPVSVSVSSSWQSVTVTLTSTGGLAFAAALGLPAPTITATATATLQTSSAPSNACALALDKTAAQAINVNNAGKISASSCPVFSDSSSTSALYAVGSGSITASSVGAVGTSTVNNGGSISPSPQTGQASQSNPYASKSITPPSCTQNGGTYTAWQSGPYQFSPFVSCGTVTIGGNGTTDQFQPGIYYIVNGNLVFNNANVTLAAGVSFVLTGSSPGYFQWTNYSGTYSMTAPTSGTTAGILVWQTCPSAGSAPASTFAGGSTLQLSGALYTPCGQLNLSNNAQIKPTSSGTVTAVADTIAVAGSAGLYVNGGAGGGGGSSTASTLRLTQ